MTTTSKGATVPGTDVPVLSADIGGSGPVYSHFEQWDEPREWHRLIPDYELGTDEPIVEHGWQIGLDTLPLRWEV